MIIQNVKVPIHYSEDQLKKACLKASGVKKLRIDSMRILKRSIDARKKPDLYYVMTVCVNEPYETPKLTDLRIAAKPEKPVVVVGAGPAGLFAAMTLLTAGLPVILLERGKTVEERTKDVESFWNGGTLDPESNVQFGEGGAGTFSDGKLNTAAKSIDTVHERVMYAFYEAGADESVQYDNRPHVGTDRLRSVVRYFRERILSLGGEILFSTKFTGFETKNNKICSVTAVRKLSDGTESILSIETDHLVLAFGHSARDTYETLLKRGVSMEAKAFAVGVRMEHPQKMITMSQYGTLDYEDLGAAPYKVTAKTAGGRGVYSFCMCPGGYVVNASSEAEHLAINGMSYADRGSHNANAGIVVQVTPDDYPGTGPLSGLLFQEELEKKAYSLLNGQIPVQRWNDFSGNGSLYHAEPTDTNDTNYLPCMKGSYGFTDLRGFFPEGVEQALLEAVPKFGRMIRGFDRPDALLSVVESRTSSPVRIPRDEHMEANIPGLYPCGEGAGYAGGIVSSAKDGVRVSEAIIRNYL